MRLVSQQNIVTEIAFQSTVAYSDPYNEVDVDVVVTSPVGPKTRHPAFWAGDKVWKFRFSAPAPGEYQFETECSAAADSGLHKCSGTFIVEPYTGRNPELQRGRIRVSDDRRHFVHQDGTPFLWIGDTWWMGLTTRIDWPQGFKELTCDRVSKGFNAIQIVAGPYPDMDAWDPRGRNEAGFPFSEGFERVNPEYYDHADLKIGHLVWSGLMPCIVGMWGYYLPQIGVAKIKRFWRNLVARYGAYPVTWCICGEGTMPYYLSETREHDQQLQKEGWSEVMQYVRTIDGYCNLITIHPTQFGRDQVTDPALMDFEMLQTGHSDLESVPNTIESACKAAAREPRMPFINSEVNYEGILGRCWQNIQRLCFYHTVLNGAAGHTYGANGIWQMNGSDKPYGPSPHGRSWGSTPWQDAAQLPGSRQIGLGGRVLAGLAWWELRSQPRWVTASHKTNDAYGCVAVGEPGKLRVIYIPLCWDPPTLHEMEPGVLYRARYVDPCNGAVIEIGSAKGDRQGNWTPPVPPECHDWLLILET